MFKTNGSKIFPAKVKSSILPRSGLSSYFLRSCRLHSTWTQGMILDYSGTTMDKYVRAPKDAFVKLFQNEGKKWIASPKTQPATWRDLAMNFFLFGVKLSNQQARGPMGNHKKIHIQKLLELPEVIEQWEDFSRIPCVRDQLLKGRKPFLQDIDRLFQDFEPMQVSLLSAVSETQDSLRNSHRDSSSEDLRKVYPNMYTTLLPGVLSTVNRLRSENQMLFGTTSGFTRAMHDPILLAAKCQGFVPNVTVAADEVPRSRPFPDACFLNMQKLGITSPRKCIKVGDTQMDIQEGKRSGCVTVGLSRYGNFMGEHEDYPGQLEEMQKRNPEAYLSLLKKARKHLAEAEPDFIVDNFEELLHVVKEVNRRYASKSN